MHLTTQLYGISMILTQMKILNVSLQLHKNHKETEWIIDNL